MFTSCAVNIGFKIVVCFAYIYLYYLSQKNIEIVIPGTGT